MSQYSLKKLKVTKNLSCASRFPDTVLLLIKMEFNSILHTELCGAMGHTLKKKNHNKEKIQFQKMKRLRKRHSDTNTTQRI